METQEKLKLILQLSGLTQTKLAARLGVSFAAFNRWINGKAKPRKKAEDKLDELYREFSGEKIIPESVIAAKKANLLAESRKHRNVLKEILDNPDIKDQFYLSLTYNSNKIEGSTLSQDNTAAILFDNAALPDKTLVEQLEVKNHQAALDYLFGYLIEKKPLDEKLLLKLHGVLMNAIRADAGNYRSHAVRVMGTYVPTANYLKVPELMKKLVAGINKKNGDVINNIASVHAKFEQIHPFSDGNGRIGRLLMHAMALKNNLAPVVVLQEKKRLYISYLNKAQMKDDPTLLTDFVCNSILEGFKVLNREP
ncbi:MAG: Fic family protein [Patescibacteria group bacterium]